MKKGKLYLIPTSITGGSLKEILSERDLDKISQLENYIVETPKIARRNLAGIPKKPLREIQMEILDKRSKGRDFEDLLKPLFDGFDVGLMSDAGAPTIADPGWRLVLEAQKKNIEIVPIVGLSSIFLALMASGLNGQRFAFNGYLSKDQEFRRRDIKRLEKESQRYDRTEIFMETPYKNQHMYEDILNVCKPDTLLCIAKNVGSDEGYIKTLPVRLWKEEKVGMDKVPALFLIYSPRIFNKRRS